MPKNTTINLRVEKELKEQAGDILASLGLSLSEAFNLMLHQVRIVHGLPFDIKQRLPYELNDGYGSYVCEYGHVHNYSRFDFDSVEREAADPDTRVYNSVDEMIADIDAEDEDA